MKSNNLTPSQVAAMIGVSTSTVRLWSTQFADFLSDAARPGAGRRRSYTPDDVGVLQRAYTALHEGKTVSDVVQLLAASPVQSGTALITTGAILGELNAARAALADTNARVDALTTELEALRAEVVALKSRRTFWDRLRRR